MAAKRTFEIKCRHEVEVTYRVTAENSDGALEALCNKELFVEYCGEPATYGPCERAMGENGIEIVDTDCYSDPSPTGREFVHRHWEIEELDEEDQDE